MRSIYYHLKKGIATQEFVVKEVRQERGEYSWGSHAEKIYYALGPKAEPSNDSRIKQFYDDKKKEDLLRKKQELRKEARTDKKQQKQ